MYKLAKDAGPSKRKPGRPKTLIIDGQEIPRRLQRKRELQEEKVIEEQTRVLDTRNLGDQANVLAASRLSYFQRMCNGPLLNRIRTEQEILDIAQLHANTRKISRLKNLTRKQKKTIKKVLIQGVNDSSAKDIIGCQLQWIRKLRCLTTEEVDRDWNSDGPNVTAEELPGTNQLEKVSMLISNMYVEFMRRHTGVMSGSNSETLTLPIAKHTLVARLFGEYPGMLRSLVISNPTIISLITEGTRLHTSITEALIIGNTIGFNATEEVEYRIRMAESEYRLELDKKRFETCKILPANVKPKDNNDVFTKEQVSRENRIKPVGDTAFWSILKKANIKFTTNLKPTLCTLCDDGALNVKLLEEAMVRRQSTIEQVSCILLNAKDHGRELNGDENVLVRKLEN